MCDRRCVPLQEANNLYDMFYIRKTLHQRAYQHKTGNAIEFMCVCCDSTLLGDAALCNVLLFSLCSDRLRDILALANDHIKIPGRDG